jgi:hypothetical protein
MRKEEAQRQQALLETHLEAVKTNLMRISDVLAVGIGVKESNKQFTDELAYRIYVPVKKDLSTLQPHETIPREINGLRTDVLTPLRVTNDSDVCGSERRNLKEYRPLRAGIAISTDSTSYGTLGWFGTLTDGTTVMLTNKHVLYDETPGVDSRKLKTAQPQLGDPSHCCCCTCGSDNVIGESIIGIRDIDPGSDTSVDCGIAKVNPDLVAAINFRINNDSTTEVLKVAGTAAAALLSNVKKIGARSGFTKGIVIHLGDLAVAIVPPDDKDSGGTPIILRQGQVLIKPDPTETYQVKEGVCKFAFSNSGDSGAVILNESNMIVALNWGGDRTTNTMAITIASKIENVLAKLSANGFPVTLAVSPAGGDSAIARVRRAETPKPIAAPDIPNILEQLRDVNEQSLLYWLYEKHHKEILTLINTVRPVTVAWQRNQGPAYVAALTRAARTDAYSVPFAINDISREQLLTALAQAFESCGTESLSSDVRKFKADIIRVMTSGESIADFAVGLKGAGFIDQIPECIISNAVI